MSVRDILRADPVVVGTPEESIAAGDRLAHTIARHIADKVRDSKTHPGIWMRVARGVAKGSVSRSELDDLLDWIEASRDKLRSPGAYFVACAKRMFAAAGEPW